MPFTLAHPAAALLLRGTPLPVAAVVAGTMAPDVPVFLRAFGGPYSFTHSVPGILTVDLAIGLVGVLVWFAWFRDPVVDVLPDAVRTRVAPHARYTRRQWLLAVPAVVAGSTTHVVWDLFTHHQRWGVRQVVWLHSEHLGHDGSDWAQYGSSVLGLLVCATWAILAVRGRPADVRPRLVPVLGTRALGLVVVLAAAAGLTAGVNHPGQGIRMFLGQTAVVGTITLGFGLVVLTVLWHTRRRGGMGRSPVV